MKSTVLLPALAVVFMSLAFQASAQTSSDPVTATCKDGTSWSGSSHRGACSHHGGVASYDSGSASDAVSNTASSAGNALSGAAASAGTVVNNAATSTKAGVAGAAGQVWVNTASHVYHCSGDTNYGHTKQGKYLSESAAKAEGDRPSRGKSCS
jgi:hypothetical protein